MSPNPLFLNNLYFSIIYQQPFDILQLWLLILSALKRRKQAPACDQLVDVLLTWIATIIIAIIASEQAKNRRALSKVDG